MPVETIDNVVFHQKDIITAQDIGRTIREAREAKGMKQESLALEVGLREQSTSHIAHIEKGRRIPSLALSVKLEEILDLQVGSLANMVIKHNLREKVTDIMREAARLGVTSKVRLIFEEHGIQYRR